MPPDPAPVDEETVRRLLREEENRRDLNARLDQIDGRFSGINSRLDKILVAIIALGGGNVSLQFVHTTPQQIFQVFIGGYLLCFAGGILALRWKLLPNLLRLILLLLASIGGGSMLLGTIGMNLVVSLIVTAGLLSLLTLLVMFAWRIDKYSGVR